MRAGCGVLWRPYLGRCSAAMGSSALRVDRPAVVNAFSKLNLFTDPLHSTHESYRVRGVTARGLHCEAFLKPSDISATG